MIVSLHKTQSRKQKRPWHYFCCRSCTFFCFMAWIPFATIIRITTRERERLLRYIEWDKSCVKRSKKKETKTIYISKANSDERNLDRNMILSSQHSKKLVLFGMLASMPTIDIDEHHHKGDELQCAHIPMRVIVSFQIKIWTVSVLR